MKLFPIMGLETHIQLNTKTKLFCRCLNEYVPDEPNKNICPFCTGQPGALPVLNKAAVQKAIIFGVAIDASIPKTTRWDRKNYFYPDLPAGYQISQYDNPIVDGGKVKFFIENKQTGEFTESVVNLTRAHLESDAGKSVHTETKTLVDFNRSGAPLIEIVTEPEIRTSSEAMGYVNELQLLVRRLGISDADMEKGQMRFDCNISLQTEEEKAAGKLPGYKVEIKNINSVRSLGRAIEYEIERQTKLLQDNQIPAQETRGWRDDLNKSISQRGKEQAHDYRYFPEPDLQILQITENDIPAKDTLGQLPNTQRQKYLDLGLGMQAANTFVTKDDVGSFFDQILSDYFLTISHNQTDKPRLEQMEPTAETSASKELIKTVANLVTQNLINLSVNLEKPVNKLVQPNQIVELSKLFCEKKINNQAVQKVLDILVENKNSQVSEIVKTEGLLKIDDAASLEAFVDVVLQKNPTVVEQYKSGKVGVIGFLLGKCMEESNKKGDPVKFKEILKQKLD